MFLKVIAKLKLFCFMSLLALTGFSISSLYAMNDNDVDALTNAMAKKAKVSHPLTLSRYSNGSLLVNYAQNLTSRGKTLGLKRTSTEESIQYVWDASQQDNRVTHLLAQGFCKGADSTWKVPLTTKLGFSGVPTNSNKKMDWVSKESTASSSNTRYIRKPQTNYWGGHAEPQLISDLNALFTKNSDAVVKLFTPPSTNAQNVYMCGLEIFGPYDMCDAHNGSSNNQYNCVGKLIDFRAEEQKGQESISEAVRNKLGSRFKGNEEDAFIVIYHAHSPYSNVDSYRAESDTHYHHLEFAFAGCSFLRKNNDFDNSYSLSQLRSRKVKSDILYGYIHQLGDKKVDYNPETQRFSFP